MRFLVPHKTPSHRARGIALFRNLLSGVISLPEQHVSDESKAALCNVVRNKFKRNRRLTSYKKLRIEYEAGYEALELMKTSPTGNETSINRILSTLALLPPALTQTVIRTLGKDQEPQKHKSPLSQGPVFSVPTPPGSILARPHPSVSGKRHVPHLVNANGYPMLRTKKPQPPGLGPYLKKLVIRRQRRIDAHAKMMNMIPIATLEDAWDHDMRLQGADIQPSQERQTSIGGNTSTSTWVKDLQNVIDEIQTKSWAEKTKTAELTRRMQRIVEEERWLAAEEEGRNANTPDSSSAVHGASDVVNGSR